MAVELRENKEHKKGTLEFLFSYQEMTKMTMMKRN